MSEASPGDGSSGQSGPDQDPWSRPADFGQPGPGETAPLAPPGDFAPGTPPAWSAVPPASWSPPEPAPSAQPAQPSPPPWAPPAQPAQPAPSAQPVQSAPSAQPARPAQPVPPPTAPGAWPPQQPADHGFSPSGQTPWAAPPPGYGPPPGQYGYGYQSPYYSPSVPRTNPVAIAALVCGLVQFLGGLVLVGNIVLAIPAIICGAIGLRQTRQRGERGRGMAIAGLVLGILGVVYFALIVVLIAAFGRFHFGST